MPKKEPIINKEMIEKYLAYQREQEKSQSTLQKYKHDLNALLEFLQGGKLTKIALIDWKEYLTSHYAPASVNAMLAAANSYVRFMGWLELSVKPLKIQRPLFLELLQYSRHEEEHRRPEWMAVQKDTDVYLETVEIAEDPKTKVDRAGDAGMGSL